MKRAENFGANLKTHQICLDALGLGVPKFRWK